MSDDRSSIAEAATSILRDLSDPDAVRQVEESGWNEKLWSVLEDSGFTRISVPESAGGSGGDFADACALVKEIGRFAAAVPVVETALLAGWAVSAAGMELPPGPATVGIGDAADTIELTRDSAGWRLSGRLHRVPWAAQAATVVVVAPSAIGDQIVMVRTSDVEVLPGRNLAGESRDTVVITNLAPVAVAPSSEGVNVGALRRRGAMARATSIAGALERVSALTIKYTAEREQFGRPLARFQAVQRHVVRIAERSQAAVMAAETAVLNAQPEPEFFDVAAAKIIAGEAATVAAQASHQAHGAIGMTKEYELGQLSRRLWAWRDEFGSEAYWSRMLGRHMAKAGADALWPRLSTGRVGPSSDTSRG